MTFVSWIYEQTDKGIWPVKFIEEFLNLHYYEYCGRSSESVILKTSPNGDDTNQIDFILKNLIK